MTIVALRKVTVYGRTAEKGAVLDSLQELGCLHLVSLRPGAGGEQATGIEHAYNALKYLTGCPRRRRPVHNPRDFDFDSVVQQALENQQRTREVSDQRDALRKRIEELTPWGDFQLPELEALRGYRLWFYIVPHYRMDQVRESGLTWQLVHRDSRYCYVVVIAREEPPSEAMPVPRTHTGALPLSEVEQRLEQAEAELERLEAEREALTRWLDLLQRYLARAEDRASLRWATGITLDHEEVFAIQGWAPADRVGDLRTLAEQRGLALSLARPQRDEKPPTLLRNAEETAGGEEIVRFYQLPSYRGWDPSAVVMFSFAAFFAMIMADAGYALLFAGLLLGFQHKLRRHRAGQRVLRMGWAVVACALVYGVLAGGYFGYTPPSDSLLGQVHVLNMQDLDTMMTISVAIGTLHLILANAITAWHWRGSRQALPPLGWIAMVVSGWLLVYRLAIPGYTLLGVGGLLVLAFSGQGGKGWFGALRRLTQGALALTAVTKAFSDVLSYLRLFALGLASASLATSFNQLAVDAREAAPEIGLLLFVLVVALGHCLNFAICVLSGVVHGLRLNVIEFYHWGVSDEGYPFRAFEKKEEKAWGS